ncbi:chemotaxis protein CheW [Pseudooceanicola aestuarii]|uniref:chemotaxis protein CheW n=1 Tax=Pseudooceanicola aestuarii TaxID=2697319 RepID=UPI0013D68277|nr:chemotaxis protein CheW [Pseudooceanicola aestuarii]
MDERPPPQGPEVLVLHISGQDFSLDIGLVREIRGMSRITPMPHAPRFICGVVNLRGAVLPVLDLSRRLDLKAEASPRNVIIVVAISGHRTGLLASAVTGIATLLPESDPPPDQSACATCVERRLVDGRSLRHLNMLQILSAETEAAP